MRTPLRNTALHPDAAVLMRDGVLCRVRSRGLLEEYLRERIDRSWALPAPLAGRIRELADWDGELDWATVFAASRALRPPVLARARSI